MIQPKRTFVWLLFGAAVLAACDSPAGPGSGGVGVIVSLTAEHTTPPAVITEEDGAPRMECRFRVGAKADGRTGASTPIRDVTLYWFFGADTIRTADSLTISADEVREAWGLDALPAGQTTYAEWWANAFFPFQGLFRLRYGSEQEPRTADVRFRCLPPLIANSGSPPTISGVVISPQQELQPGDTFAISFSTKSTVGLWLTRVEILGATPARRIVAGNLTQQQNHTLHFEVGANAHIGSPMMVSVSAVDGLLQEPTPVTALTPQVYDRTPPDIYPSFTTEVPSGRDQGLVGQYAPGDLIKLNVRARDNHRLAFVVYEFGQPASFRGSVAVEPGFDRDHLGRSVPLTIPVRSEWAGTTSLSLHVRDVAGNASEPREAHPDSFRIYPEVQAPTRRHTLPFRVTAAVHDPAGRRLALLPRGQTQIQLFSLESMSVVQTLPLPALPSGADFTAGGDSLIVALPAANAFAVIDLTAGTPDPSLIPLTVSLPRQQQLHDLRVINQEMVLAILRAEVGQEDEALELSLSSGSQRLMAELRTPYENTRRFRLARSTDHSSLVLRNDYSDCLHRYSPDRREFGSCQTMPSRVSSHAAMSLSHTGASLLLGNVVVNSDLVATRQFWISDSFFPAVIAADGEHAYQTQWRGIARIRVMDGQYLERYPAPIPAVSIPEAVFVSPRDEVLVMLIPLLEETEIVQVSRP